MSSRADSRSSTATDQAEAKTSERNNHFKVKEEPRDNDAQGIVPTSESRQPTESSRARKRTYSFDNKVDSSENSSDRIKTENFADASPGTSWLKVVVRGSQRENRIEVDSDNNVNVILKSRKVAGVRDLLQAERLNKTAIELQLTAQSQCAVRGRSNSSSYSSDFISSALSSTGGSTRSKRLHR